MKKIIFLIIFFFFTTISCYSQNNKRIAVKAQIIDGDTLIIMKLPELNVYGKYILKSRKKIKKYNKLVRNVKKVYPYAKLAGIKLTEYETMLAKASNEKKKRKLLKPAEQELKEEFGDDLQKFTFSQGKILIKLVDRETGNSSYELIQELRGKFLAFFWQTFARIFGYNLKVKYDPDGKDKEIETIVLMIENGII